jgi:hypothetical protein
MLKNNNDGFVDSLTLGALFFPSIIAEGRRLEATFGSCLYSIFMEKNVTHFLTN